jgi:hypothetical protein
VHLTAPDVEIDAAQGLDAREGLRHSSDIE